MDRIIKEIQVKMPELVSRAFKGLWIPKELWFIKELNFQEKCLLAEIDSLCNAQGCKASNRYFAAFFGLSEDSISKYIAHLRTEGYIKETAFNGKVRTLKTNFTIQLRLRKNDEADSARPITQGRKKSLPSIKVEQSIEQSIDYTVQSEALMKQFPTITRVLIDDFIELAKNKNKTKTITIQRKFRIINELHIYFTKTDKEKFHEALKITVDNEVPNINYMKKVYENLGERKKVHQKFQTRGIQEEWEEGRKKSQSAIEKTQREVLNKYDYSFKAV